MPKAISYVRFSSVIQGEGSSTERQEALIGSWLKQNPDYELSNLSAKDLGRSGFKGEHLKHGLGGILEAIKSEKIARNDVLLVEALDRLGRLPPLEMTQLIGQIVTHGVRVITLEDGQEYTAEKLNSMDGSHYVLIGKVQQAHYYSKNLSNRIKKAYEAKRRKAKEGENIRLFAPFWLNTDGTIKENEGACVRECIDLYLKGRGTRRILLDLHDKYPALMGVHPTTLKRWFKNRALLGEWANKGDPIKNVFEPLISEEQFYLLQNQLSFKSKTMSPEVSYFLSGLVVCAQCGSSFHYRRKAHKDYVIKYSNCSTYLKRGPVYCKNNKTWPYEVLFFIYEKTHSNCVLNVMAGRVASAVSNSLEVLVRQEEEISKKIKKLVDLFVGEGGLIKEVRDKISSLNAERKEIEERINIERGRLVNESDSLSGASLNEFLFGKIDKMDEFNFRNVLRKNGYLIKIDGAVATVQYEIVEARKRIAAFKVYRGLNQMDSSEFVLLRRSSKYNCYVVRQSVFYNCPDANGDNTSVSYNAIFRDGRVVSSNTEEGLILRLENPDSPVEKLNHRPWMAEITIEADKDLS